MGETRVEPATRFAAFRATDNLRLSNPTDAPEIETNTQDEGHSGLHYKAFADLRLACFCPHHTGG